MELHVTRSAISMQIKELEVHVGLPLFGRGRKSACLTMAGELFLRDVDRALLALKDGQNQLNRLRGLETGVVSIGMVCNAEFFLPRVLAMFCAAHPAVELRVSVSNREKLLRQLADSEITLGIMGRPPEDMNMEGVELGDQPLGIVAAPHHELAQTRGISVATVMTHALVVRERGSGTRAAADRFFSDCGRTPKYAMELAGNESIKQAVMGDMGLGFMSLQTAAPELRSGMLVALDVVGLPLKGRWHVVHRQDEPLSRAAASLRNAIVEISPNFIRARFDTVAANPPAEVAAQLAVL